MAHKYRAPAYDPQRAYHFTLTDERSYTFRESFLGEDVLMVIFAAKGGQFIMCFEALSFSQQALSFKKPIILANPDRELLADSLTEHYDTRPDYSTASMQEFMERILDRGQGLIAGREVALPARGHLARLPTLTEALQFDSYGYGLKGFYCFGPLPMMATLEFAPSKNGSPPQPLKLTLAYTFGDHFNYNLGPNGEATLVESTSPSRWESLFELDPLELAIHYSWVEDHRDVVLAQFLPKLRALK